MSFSSTSGEGRKVENIHLGQVTNPSRFASFWLERPTTWTSALAASPYSKVCLEVDLLVGFTDGWIGGRTGADRAPPLAGCYVEDSDLCQEAGRALGVRKYGHDYSLA
ncbi:unnamed protein product [Lupinus luteus]|uniref:Uncharacterized protein n=1 Tax=Lupinus luteus TaxID=3873 RepID=A0AAV1W2A1_LUPLU